VVAPGRKTSISSEQAENLAEALFKELGAVGTISFDQFAQVVLEHSDQVDTSVLSGSTSTVNSGPSASDVFNMCLPLGDVPRTLDETTMLTAFSDLAIPEDTAEEIAGA
jgi:hypothetical protein